jgi:hypothetical protein
MRFHHGMTQDVRHAVRALTETRHNQSALALFLYYDMYQSELHHILVFWHSSALDGACCTTSRDKHQQQHATTSESFLRAGRAAANDAISLSEMFASAIKNSAWEETV